MDVVRLEVLDRFEQFLERAPEAVEAGDTEAVTGAGMVDEFAQPGTLELSPGDHVDEDANGAGLVQAVFLGGDVLVRGGHASIAEYVVNGAERSPIFGTIRCPIFGALSCPI